MKNIERMNKRPSGKRVQFYRDVQGCVRWTQYGGNGRIVAAATEGFSDEDAAMANWKKSIQDGLDILGSGDVFYKFDAETFDRVE